VKTPAAFGPEEVNWDAGLAANFVKSAHVRKGILFTVMVVEIPGQERTGVVRK
jgi:hypothetical protein